MTQQIAIDHLRLKLPQQKSIDQNSPLILENITNTAQFAETVKEFEGLEQVPLEVIQLITGVKFAAMKRRSASRTNTYRPVFTLNNLIDVEFRRFGEHFVLDSIVVHGSGWGVAPYGAEKMIATAARYGLQVAEVHYALNISPNIVSWKTIEKHFNPTTKAFTCTSSLTPFTSADRADGTKVTGYRAGGASSSQAGFAVSFYPAWQVHPELPDGVWRLEVQARGAVAQQLMAESSRISAVLGLIRNRIAFRSLTQTNKNYSERSIPTWWSELLRGAGAFRISKPNPEPALERRKERLIIDFYSRLLSIGEPTFIEGLQEFLKQKLPDYVLQGQNP